MASGGPIKVVERRRSGFTLALALCLPLTAPACGDDEDKGSGTAGDASTGGTAGTSASTSAGTESTTSAGTSDATSDSTTAGVSASDTAPTGTDTDTGGVNETTDTANDPGNPLDCGGTIYACGDGMDNDGDGHTDLEDPECTGPCDDDESSFQTGIPGDNMDCRQDCFFDGNSGQGDDGCLWNLKCDPENPGANVNCEYSDTQNCNNSPPNQDPECVEFCSQFVPPGCDCFGCCTVITDDGPVNIFLNSGPDCSLDNLEGCESCTVNDSCGNTCAPEECELCFGQDPADLPPDCQPGGTGGMETDGGGGNICDNQLPCMETADCPTDFFCYLGCCYPPPPG